MVWYTLASKSGGNRLMAGKLQPSRRGRPKGTTRAPNTPTQTVQALDRGLKVLVFLADNQKATLSEISRNTNTPVASTHRILATLQQRGMVLFNEQDGHWCVGAQAFRVGNAYQAGSNLMTAATPVMEELARLTGETANLAIEDGGELLYLIQVESDNPIRASIKNGAASYFHTSGVGKILLAHMDNSQLDRFLKDRKLARQTSKSITQPDHLKSELAKIRDLGWALDDEERYMGMRCIAAPVFDTLGKVIAGVSISGPSVRFPDNQLQRIADKVQYAANRITSALESTTV
ncbi:IclR family transcriptional regulator [Roseibium sp. AS2]|uniref:IclR family transcriptional regulator n=1 Tax=Roseibium sp. AS2 TaxID=3135781 RepID=UPI00317019F8